MKKTLSVLLALATIICMLTATTVVASAAETDTQSGIEVTLVTDKDAYSSGEDIKVTVNVKNTNTYDVNDVSITVELPEGITLKSGDLSISDVDIAAGETYSKEVIAVKEIASPSTDEPTDNPTDNPADKPSTGNTDTGDSGNGNVDAPQTGDSSSIFLCIALLAISAVGVFFAIRFRKKATRFLSLFLCIAMVSALVPIGVIAADGEAEDANTVSIAVDKTITVDTKEYIIKANIVYQTTHADTYYTVNFDPNGDNVENMPASQRIKAGGYIEQTEEPVRDNYIFYGWHVSPLAEVFVDNPVDFSSYPVDENVTFYAIWIDCEYDVDGDGLSFKEESVYNTDPFCYDSDEDGLSDYDEIVVYHTNPLLADTDSDGISDVNEISLQLNPLEAKSDSITLDSSRVLSTTFNDVFSDMTLDLTATAGALCTAKIQSYDTDIIENPKGYLSKIIDIEYSQKNDFEKATLVFDYSKLNLDGIDEDNLSFYYLNEETNSLEIVQSVVDTDNKLVITEPKHFSMYVVADRLSVTSNFSFNIRYIDNNLSVRNIANTNFDVLQHAFAFHNFQVKSCPGGFCYGFSYATFLNYIGKLPVSMEGKTGWFTSYPAYDLSGVDCFFENQLYQDSQKELFVEENNYYADNVSMDASTIQTVQCIENLFFKQHNIKDKFAGSLSSNDNFSYLIDKLKADEPVMLSLIKLNGVHSVLATGILESVNENDVYYISIYDCNEPGKNSYIKATRKWHKGSFALQYGSYTNIRLSVIDIPESDSYVTHSPLSAGTLTGKICKASDRSTAISGATINVYRNNILYTTQTADATGNYTMNLPAGQYYIVISAEGYIDFRSYATVKDGEDTYMETFLMVEGSEDEIGIASGRVINSITGAGIEGVTLTVRKDWNNANEDEETVTTAITDFGGNYSIELPLGNYTVIASKDGYITSLFNIVVQPGTTNNQNGTITPEISGDEFLITLTWDKNPRDLDAHVEGTLSNGEHFHVSFRNKYQYDGDVEVCNLDYDDTNSYGPEHITLRITTDKPYYYYIYKFYGSGTIANSGAKITIHQGNTLIAEYNVPTNLGGDNYWNVFAIKDGQLINKNTITSYADTSYAD